MRDIDMNTMTLAQKLALATHLEAVARTQVFLRYGYESWEEYLAREEDWNVDNVVLQRAALSRIRTARSHQF